MLAPWFIWFVWVEVLRSLAAEAKQILGRMQYAPTFKISNLDHILENQNDVEDCLYLHPKLEDYFGYILEFDLIRFRLG